MDPTEETRTDFPRWAYAIICLVILFVILIIWYIWIYRDSFWSCLYMNRGTEDSIIIPLPQEGPEQNLHRASSSGINLSAENRNRVKKIEQQITKRTSNVNEDLEVDSLYACHNAAIVEEHEDNAGESDAGSVSNVSDDIEFESLLSKAKAWHAELLERGAWRDACYTSNRFIAGLFDKDGGMLRMENMGIRLLIPPGAIGGGVELIYIYVATEQIGIPLTEPGKIRASPTVFCGPHGMQFLERVVLSYEHCANIHDEGTNLLPMFTSSLPSKEMHFTNLEEEDDVLVIKRDGRCSIMISHFTGFSSIATSANPDQSLEIFMNLVVYSSFLHHSSTDMILRLYFVHKTADALHNVFCEEESLEGIKLTPFTPWLIDTNGKSITRNVL
ncbi:netrin receptor UNC5A-like [Anneissia japonica]|uniref:netrin receptor UNC5A-like n=1 Tax=Anneissia japonica TaxID=1529436 RepID=UPI001425550B|nr:netrin receptor UNC5A-like [Anneissia japonica]